jgi:hypothetical protein
MFALGIISVIARFPSLAVCSMTLFQEEASIIAARLMRHIVTTTPMSEAKAKRLQSAMTDRLKERGVPLSYSRSILLDLPNALDAANPAIASPIQIGCQRREIADGCGVSRN